MALEKIGPYKFQGILGRGGMGTVYRGVHEDTGEIHAIKVLAPTYAHDEHFRGRFESEIKALIKLDHPNIVRLISYGQEDAMLFFSMEIVEGNSLFQMQKKGHQFGWREVLEIAKDVSKGLRHAHDRGVIHRDLKPGNLLMTKDDGDQLDFVKITDFGIAKRFGTSQNTGDNVLGTMDFMSPEQAKGEPVTIRSDLYSLGTVLYTLLSGRPPFTANSVEESLRNLTRVPAPHVSTVVPDVPDELDDIIKRLMAKRPENRIQTAQSLLHQIEEVEIRLRGYSEARTDQRSPLMLVDDTFHVSTPRTTENTNVKSNANVVERASQTLELTDHPEELMPLANTHIDYFETVSEKVRGETDQNDISRPPNRGIWSIALALVVVVVLAGFGIIQSNKAPSAEELYSAIEMSADQPHLVLDEIETFLKHYPDEERADQIKKMKRVGESIALYNTLCNTLAVRRNLPGETRLTDIEKQFLRIVDAAENNPARANSMMGAFVTFYDNSKLNIRDQKCLDAARGYKVKIQNDARAKVLANLKQIRSAMKRAAKTTVPDDAIQIYQSILELYGNVNWGSTAESREGRNLVQKARNILSTMQAAKRKVDEAELDNDKSEREDDSSQPPTSQR